MLWPGLYGGFHLDDYPNLSGLPGPNTDFIASLGYLLDTPVGGSGRPIAYLSFLFQAEHWPGNPFPFKLVNLFIHLVNGALVSALAYLIGKVVWAKEASPTVLEILSLSAGFVWIILPMNLSTVFYVVQRMTLLSSTMTLVALAGYCYLRMRHDKWTRLEYLMASMAVGVGYFGVFAKETAILTGLLILTVEYSVFSSLKPPLSRIWMLVFLVLPVALVFGYLLLAGKIFGGYGHREFSISERLVSESVIVLEYLSKVLAPTNARINLYNDGYPFQEVARNFWLVGFSVIGLAALNLVALSCKDRFLSLGILFFFAGHVLESTVIPLELYFEHRNYIPSVGLIIALVLGVGSWLSKLRQASQWKGKVALVLFVSWVGWLGVVCAIEARVWGDPRAFSIAAFTERPNSLRARQEIGTYLMSIGDYASAATVLYSMDSDFGVFAGTYAQLLLLKCHTSEVPVPTESKIIAIFETAAFDRGTESALQEIWRMKRPNNDRCPSVSTESLLDAIHALLNNPNYKYRNNLHVLKSLVLADQRQWLQAAESVNRIGQERVSIDELILGARYYGLAGEIDKALSLLREAESRTSGLLSEVVHQKHIDEIRADIISEDSDVNDRVSPP
ncbi:hypothetical protein SAMN04488073_0957 [Marinobacter gudaonensis]|uniref:Uncharacterized protein n=1 Tax=Marinobacter gudaonensis TaxID=375760 RepID=A0A1I6GJE2_9GAMM|nr:hypothetical protein SAMN04488073_0957 [Marinobacter gudaonensis]